MAWRTSLPLNAAADSPNFCHRSYMGVEHRSLCCEFEEEMGRPHTSRVVCLQVIAGQHAAGHES
jgi:hypothetical protein